MEHSLHIQLENFNDKYFMLSGVETATEEITDEWSNIPKNVQVMKFVLNGVVFNAVEDPQDGYRSMLDMIYIGGEVSNTFPPVKVYALWSDPEEVHAWSYRDEIIEFTDCKSDEVVLRIGTSNVDDYYPCYVANFHPENMCINQ